MDTLCNSVKQLELAALKHKDDLIQYAHKIMQGYLWTFFFSDSYASLQFNLKTNTMHYPLDTVKKIMNKKYVLNFFFQFFRAEGAMKWSEPATSYLLQAALGVTPPYRSEKGYTFF